MKISQFLWHAKEKLNKTYIDFSKKLSTKKAKKYGNILFNTILLSVAVVLLVYVVASSATTFFGVALIGLAIANTLAPGSVTKPLSEGFNKIVNIVSDLMESITNYIKKIFAKPARDIQANCGLASESDDEDLVSDSKTSIWKNTYNYLPRNPIAYFFSSHRTGDDLYKGSYQESQNGSPILGKAASGISSNSLKFN